MVSGKSDAVDHRTYYSHNQGTLFSYFMNINKWKNNVLSKVNQSTNIPIK